MNRRIAISLVLTLLVQSLLPGVALALPVQPSSPQTLLICTGDGLKQVELDRPPQDDQPPQAQHCCPCAVPCSACVLPGVERTSVHIVHAVAAPRCTAEACVAPIATHAPPPHQSRAPPVLS